MPVIPKSDKRMRPSTRGRKPKLPTSKPPTGLTLGVEFQPCGVIPSFRLRSTIHIDNCRCYLTQGHKTPHRNKAGDQWKNKEVK